MALWSNTLGPFNSTSFIDDGLASVVYSLTETPQGATIQEENCIRLASSQGGSYHRSEKPKSSEIYVTG